MHTGGYTWRRARARLGLVALLLAMSALVVATLAGTLGYLDVASTGGLRDAVGASTPSAQVLQVQTRLADDPQAQHEGTQALLDEALPADALTWSTIRTPPLPLADGDDRAVLVVDDAIADHAELTAGSWPAAPDETAVQDVAAETLGLAVGDTVTVTSEESSTELTIVGLWTPEDPDDVHWAGDQTVATGSDPLNAETYGPFVVAAEALDPLTVAPYVQWTIATGPDLAPESLDAWLAALPDVAPALDEAGLTVRGVTTSGTLPTTLAHAQESLVSVRASSAIPLLIVALVSLVALWQITRLLAAIRERETLVLLSRGAAPAQLVRIGATEAAVVACGALLGGAIVVVAFSGRSGYELRTTALVAAGTAVAVLAIMVAAVARAAARGLHPEGESGRASAALAGSALVLVAGLAAFALWRFTRNGSPLVPGTQQVDIVAVGAPALGLIAVALAAVALAGPLSRALAAAGARRPGFSPVTELRQSSRRITVNAVPVVLVVLAASIATLASGYAGTWQALRTTSAQVSVGADARVETAGGLVNGKPRGVAEVSQATGTSATGVVQTPLRLDEQVGQLSALPMTDIGVSSAPAELLDPAAAVLQPATDPLPGLDLPADPGELTLDVTVSATGQAGDVSAWRSATFRVWLRQGPELIAIEVGSVTVRAADSMTWDFEAQEFVQIPDLETGQPVSEHLSATVPPGTWRVVAVDTVMDTSNMVTQWAVDITGLTAGGTDLMTALATDWDPGVLAMPGASGAAQYNSSGPLGFTGAFVGELGSGPYQPLISPTVQRFMPPSDASSTVPVVTSPGWGEQIRPDGTDVLLATIPAQIVQVGTIAVVPGNPDPAAALADLPTLQNVLLRTTADLPAITQVWVDGGDRTPTETADVLREALGPRAQVVAAGDGVSDAVAAPARIVYWVAAVCALLLALPAIGAVAMTQATSRRGEVVVLRAVGVGATQQRRSRTRELMGLELGAVVAGVLAGWLLSRQIMVPLIRSTTPQTSRAVPLELTFAWVPGLVLVGVVVGTVAAVALWYGARVRSQARDTTWREEIR